MVVCKNRIHIKEYIELERKVLQNGAKEEREENNRYDREKNVENNVLLLFNFEWLYRVRNVFYRVVKIVVTVKVSITRQ